MSKPTINRALRYVSHDTLPNNSRAYCFRFVGDPMVLVSEDKGLITPIAALGFKAQEQQGQCTTIYQREPEKFHGLISVANQSFQLDLTNLCGSLDHESNENRQLNFNILQDGKLINEVNVVRAWETVEVKSHQQHGNKRLILEEETKMVDDKPKSITIQENEASSEPKKGAVFEVVVTPQTGDLSGLFKNKKLYWVSVDKLQNCFVLIQSDKSKHQVELFQDGVFEIKKKQVYRGFEFNFGSSGSDNNALSYSGNQTQAFGLGSTNNPLSTATYFGSWGFTGSSNAPQLENHSRTFSRKSRSSGRDRDDGRDRSRSRERDPVLGFGSNTNAPAPPSSSNGIQPWQCESQLTRSLEWGEELEESNACTLQDAEEDLEEMRELSEPLGPRGHAEVLTTAESKQDLIMQSKVGKLAFGDQLVVNSSKCAAEFDYSLTSKVCRLELSVQPRLHFLDQFLDWKAVAKARLEQLKQPPKLTEDIEIFKADECCVCLEQGPDLVLFPCHHQCMHVRCEDSKLKKCPFCRAVITAKLLV